MAQILLPTSLIVEHFGDGDGDGHEAGVNLINWCYIFFGGCDTVGLNCYETCVGWLARRLLDAVEETTDQYNELRDKLYKLSAEEQRDIWYEMLRELGTNS